MSRVLVKGEWIPVEELEGSSEVDEAVAYSLIAQARRTASRSEYNSGMMSGVKTMGGDPRKARKSFRFHA